jgi:hypothetical protein
MKHLTLIQGRSDEQTGAAVASHSPRQKPVGVGVFLAGQAAFELRFGTHRLRRIEVNCTHSRHARGQFLFFAAGRPFGIGVSSVVRRLFIVLGLRRHSQQYCVSAKPLRSNQST